MESSRHIEDLMDPRAKERHEEEHGDSKKERKARTTSHCIENHKITSKSNQVEELKVVMKNSV